MSQPEVITLEIPRSPKYVAVARKTVESIGVRAKLTDQQLSDIQVAVGEACSNAVKHADPNSPRVSLQYRISPHKLEIVVRNSGLPFSWKDTCKRTCGIEDMPENGLGLFLIKTLVDEMTIESHCGVTAITMVKNL